MCVSCPAPSVLAQSIIYMEPPTEASVTIFRLSALQTMSRIPRRFYQEDLYTYVELRVPRMA